MGGQFQGLREDKTGQAVRDFEKVGLLSTSPQCQVSNFVDREDAITGHSPWATCRSHPGHGYHMEKGVSSW